MTDEGTPPGPPRFPPVDEPRWPPPTDGPPGQPPGYGPPGWSPGYGPPGSGPQGYGPPGWSPGPRHWLHPLDVGRAFSSAYRLYRLHWRAMLGAMIVLFLPAFIVYIVVEVFVVGPPMATWQSEYAAALQRRDFNELPLPPAIGLLSILTALIMALVGALAAGAVIRIVDASYGGGSATASEAIRAALARWMSLIGVYLAMFGVLLAVVLIGGLSTTLLALLAAAIGGIPLAVFAGLIGLVGTFVAVIFVFMRWALAVQVVMCEGAGALSALGRSWRLVTGSTWRVLGYTLLFGLLIGLVGVAVGIVILIIFGAPFTASPDFTPVTLSPSVVLAQAVIGGLASLLATPWWLAVLTLLYYDLRWQRGELPAASTSTGNPAPIG